MPRSGHYFAWPGLRYMLTVSKKLTGMVVDDNRDCRWLLQRVFEDEWNVRISHSVSSNSEALSALTEVAERKRALDFIVTDIAHPGPNGVDLVREIRSLPMSVSQYGGLRLRHVPISVITGSVHGPYRDSLARIDPGIKYLSKPLELESLKEVIDSVCDYRHQVLSDLQRSGLCVYWCDGRYHIAGAYIHPTRIETKYILAPIGTIARGYSRLVLVDACWTSAHAALSLFEEMINDPTIVERDLHNFFERHPEFLTGDDHDSYWSEPPLRSADGHLVRPDFVLQPGGDRTCAWNWSLVELKPHTLPLLIGDRSRIDLAHNVYRTLTQLRDYQDFFEDPRNIATIEHRFGGVCPRPRLVAILGRRPTCPNQRLALTTLIQRVNGIKILSYDEVLERRRLVVSRWQSMRGRKRPRT